MARDFGSAELTVNERIEILKRISWLSEAQRNRFAADGLFVRYLANQSFFRAQSFADRVFFLLVGFAKAFYSYQRHEVLITHLVVGDIFGVDSLLLNSKHRYESKALSDCLVMTIAPPIFAEVVFGSSLDSIAPALANTIGGEFELTSRYIQSVALGSRGKLALVLLEMARKFGVREARGILLLLQISHSDLAAMVGSSRQHVTTQLKALERDGCMVREGRRLIVIPERLQKVLVE